MLFPRLQRLFRPALPTWSRLSPSEQLAARSLHSVLLLLLIWLALWFALALPFVVVRKLASGALSLVLVIAFLASLYRLRQGHVRQATWIYTGSLWCWAAVMAFFSGGIRSVALIGFLPGFVTAATLLGMHVAISSGMLFLAFALVLALLDMAGIRTPQYFPLPPLTIWMGSVVTAIIVALPVNELIQFLRKSFEVAQHQLDALRTSAQSLRESEARNRVILESVRDAIVVADAQTGESLSVNPAAERLSGGRPQELQNLLKQRAPVAPGLSEAVVTRPDGTSTPVELSSSSVSEEEGRQLLVGVFRDISERKATEMERATLEDRVRQVQRLETVGRLAGGIAHDFNNLLTVVSGFSQLVLSRLDPMDENRSAMEEISKASERAAALTQQLLTFSRKQMTQPRPLDLHALLAEVQPMVRSLLPGNVEVVIRRCSAEAIVEADPGQMHQVVMNLITNARDAMPDGGRLLIETRIVKIVDGSMDFPATLVPGSYVMLAVSDTGTGMPENVRGRVFEPFFTTKEVGKGTGLGLSTVYGIVQQSLGTVTVESALGSGSTFRVYLPVCDAQPSAADVPAAATDQGWETILVVEDQENVRKLIVQILTTHGYRVLEAGNGFDALDEAARHPGALHLMLTDVVMPGMHGPELAQRLRSLRPEAKILFTSGYSETHAAMEEGAAYISKPFTPAGLVGKLREVLKG